VIISFFGQFKNIYSYFGGNDDCEFSIEFTNTGTVLLDIVMSLEVSIHL